MTARGMLILLVLTLGVAFVTGSAQAQTARADSSAHWDPFWRVSQVGVNYGYASTSEGANAVFGNGREWTVFVNQRAWKVFGVRVVYGNISLGQTNTFEESYLTAIDLFAQSYSGIALTFDYFALGPSIHLDLGVRHGLTLAAAYGFYTIILDLTDTKGRSFVPRNKADGWNASAAYSLWPWEKLAFRFEVDYHAIETDPSEVDLFNVFAGGEDPRLWSYQFGIVYAYGNIFE